MSNKNTCLKLHLAANKLWNKGSIGKSLAKLIRYINQIVHGCYIGNGCRIDPTVRFVHNGLGVVIHADAIIERDVSICQQVTLGVKDIRGGVLPLSSLMSR